MALAYPLDVTDEVYVAGTGWVALSNTVSQVAPCSIKLGATSEQSKAAPAEMNLSIFDPLGDWNPENPAGAFFDLLGRNFPWRRSIRTARDTATRSVVNGWGFADTGESWNVPGAEPIGDYSVAAGALKISAPAAGVTYLTTLGGDAYLHAQVSAKTTLTLGSGASVTGASLDTLAPVLRYQQTGALAGQFYYVRLTANTTGTMDLGVYHSVNGLIDSAVTSVLPFGTATTVVAQIENQTIRAKVFPTGTAEPYDWHLTVSDIQITVPGLCGLRAVRAGGNTNGTSTFTADDLEIRSIRFSGIVTDNRYTWNKRHNINQAELKVTGPLNRLQRPSVAPLKSSLRRGYLADNIDFPVAYWPCEEGRDGSRFESAIPGNPPMTFTGTPSLAGFDRFPCSQPVPIVGKSVWSGPVPTYTATGMAQMRFLIYMPPEGIPDNTPIASLYCTGTAAEWRLIWSTSPGIYAQVFNSVGTLVFTAGTVGIDLRGKRVRLSLELTQSGANINYGISTATIDDASFGVASGTANTLTIGIATLGRIGTGGLLDQVACGHLLVQSNVTPTTELRSELFAWVDENTAGRGIRICGEEHIPFGSDNRTPPPSARLGPQRPIKTIEILRENEAADGGILLEPRIGDGMLTYICKSGLARDPDLTLSYAVGTVAEIKPAGDDKPIANRVVAARTQGGVYTAEQTTGPMNTGDPDSSPDAVGVYESQPTGNLFSELQLPNFATWALNVGTVPDRRFPTITFDLRATGLTTAQRVALLALGPGSRLVLQALTAAKIYRDLDFIVIGVFEVFADRFQHRITFNVAPYEPYRIGVWDAAASRYAPIVPSTLAAGIASAPATLSVASTAGLWTTAATDFPLDVVVGRNGIGQRMTISGISGAASPQTFTVSNSSVNGVARSWASGTPVELYQPVRYI